MSNRDRQPRFEGIRNIRDLGGLKAAGGLVTGHRRLYRSGDLSRMTQKDLRQFAELNIGEIHDLRLAEEVELYPTATGIAGAHHIYGLRVIDLESVFEAAKSGRRDFTAEDAAAVVTAGYETAIERLRPELARIFDRLSQSGDGAALIHCMTGKDRTGITVALILAALGVREEAIVEDYVLTQRHIRAEEEAEKTARILGRNRLGPVNVSVLRPVFEARRDYIVATLRVLNAKFGGIETYVTQSLGLPSEASRRLRERFLR